jgi:hypothetical protein
MYLLLDDREKEREMNKEREYEKEKSINALMRNVFSK